MTGRRALVTGAGSGIGEACAECLSQSGAKVWVNDIDANSASRVAEKIGGSPIAGDVADPGDWLQPVVEGGPLHVLVHNAGYDLNTPIGSTRRQDFERLFGVMVTGPFEMTQRLLPCLSAAGEACVIYVASVHATCTTREMSAYAAAKGALVSMVKSAAQDLGKYGIRCLSVSPGYVETPLLESWYQTTPNPAAARRRAHDLHPLGRVGKPSDIGAFVTFLASSQAEFINGANLIIDGGLTAMQVE